MSPRLGALATLLVVPALPLLVSAPAHAATPIICVNRPADETDCTARPATIPDAIGLANADAGDNVIRIGPGTYADGPYTFDGTLTGSLTVQGSNNGSGTNATVLQGAAASPYVTVKDATLRNVRVTVSGSGGQGVAVSGTSGLLGNVIVADTDQAPAAGATGISVSSAKVQNSTVSLYRSAGNTGVVMTGASVVSRITTRASSTGVVADNGTPAIDNAVIDLGSTGQVGLRVGSAGVTTDVTVAAKHLTVVGGAAGSRGVYAFADAAAAASAVVVDNSIVRGPAFSAAASATAGSADVDLRYSDYQTEQETGAGAVDPIEGNVVNVDPAFRDPAGDYELRAGSPVVDKASLLLTTGTDRDDRGHAFDGDGNGTQLPDMGAFELSDITKPVTTFTAAPPALTNNRQPVFQFRTNEDGAEIECSLDGGAFQACTSPATTPPLADGAHQFSVRATDAAFNVEAPVTRAFTVDATAPNTLLTKKPQKRFFKQKVKFKFASTEPGSRFQCQLDNRGWKNCKATWKFNTKVGKHKLLVRAVDAAGNIDSSPARYKFKRLKRGR